jgi:hypothetical protein
LHHHNKHNLAHRHHGIDVPWTLAGACLRSATVLPGSVPLSKEAVVSALAKVTVWWGKADKKKGVLLRLTKMGDMLLANLRK